MRPFLVIAGLPLEVFDALRAESQNRFAPNGILFAKPVKWAGYSNRQADQFFANMERELLGLTEHERVSLSLLYVDYADASTTQFRAHFSPFALSRPLRQFEIGADAGQARRNRAHREYLEYVADEASELRRRTAIVRVRTDVQNVTPLLLPKGNFRSRHFDQMVERLFAELGTDDNPAELLDAEIAEFTRHHPRVLPPEESKSCYSDGILYFRSPGRHRHGYYRHQGNQGHSPKCLLNARSRFGGTFDHTFHYDCVPKRSLAARYPNCHGCLTPPKERHVNIAPNDFVI